MTAYNKPKRIPARQIPSMSASKTFKNAEAKLLGQAGPLYSAALLKAHRADKAQNMKIIKAARAGTAKLLKQARQGKKISFEKVQAAADKQYTKAKFLQLKSHYNSIATLTGVLGLLKDKPHIDRIECAYGNHICKRSMRPNLSYHLFGTGFGQTPGKAYMQLANGVVQLHVGTWTDTEVIVSVDSNLEGVVPWISKVWVEDSAGVKSNSYSIPFRPRYRRHYWWVNGPDIWGAPFGDTRNGTICSGITLRNGYWIERVIVSGTGSGHGEAREPHASGTSLAQGYHLGASSTEHVELHVTYYILGPKGVTHSKPAGIDSTHTEPGDLPLYEF